MTIAQSNNGIGRPTAVPFGNDYLVSWVENGDFYERRLSANEKIHVASASGSIELGPGSVLARWQDAGGNRLVRRVDTADDAHPDVYLPAEERTPSVASDGVTTMVAWAENDVRVARVAPDGTPLDGSGIVISQSPVHPAGPVQIVFENNRYLVFWASQSALWARYVERDGTPSGNVFRVSSDKDNVFDFQAAWTGGQYLLTWRPQFGGLAVLATMAPGGIAALPVGSYSGLGALTGGPHPMVFGQRTDSRVSVTFFDTKAISDLLFIPPGSGSFHAASNGRDYVITWTTAQSTGNSHAQYIVWAAKLDDRANTIGAPMPIATFETPPAFGIGIPFFDGTSYRIVYAGATLGEAILGDDAFTCRCFARTEVPFGTASIQKFSAAIGAGGSIAAYNRPVTLPDGGSVRDRVFVRFMRPVPERHRAAGH